MELIEEVLVETAKSEGTLLDVENKEDGNYHSKRLCIHTKGITNVFESFKIVYKGKVYWVRAKEVSGWIPDFELTDEDGSESDESQSDDGLQEGVIGDERNKKKKKQGEDDVSVVPDSMADKVNDNDGEDIEQNEAVDKNSTDPFGFYSLLRKNKRKDNHESSCKESLKSSQETKMEDINLFDIKKCWGNFVFDYAFSESNGLSEYSVWEEKPDVVKKEFVNHFRARFEQPSHERPIINMEFPNQLNSFQVADLEAEVSIEEIKKAVWDCAAVKYFFQTGTFYKGCNSSFISLIPKIPDAKLVKDFRPICLIGSLYKIITKILANRIMLVLGNLVNEVQSAFMADRQILDGPFILNEVYQCSVSENRGVDDYKCLRTSRGSVLVNGSPTEEFQFFKGLKQGDPLAPFLFILWNLNNIDTIIHVLKCFHLASRLNINLGKSKLMGIAVPHEVLVSKDKGGLGVSSLFALNRALLIKWVWRFKTQNNLLWTRVIKAIHGDKGKIGIVRRWRWTLDASGNFSLLRFERALDDIPILSISTQTRWIKEVPIKVNVLAWKVRLDCLPSRLNLSRRVIFSGKFSHGGNAGFTVLSSHRRMGELA
ncbi:hypothetical protein Tco_1316906 [Tanacetum coccineum]